MKYWILRAAPEFRLLDWWRAFHWLSDNQLVDDWPVGDEQVEPGDIVFILHTDDTGDEGFMAQGTVAPCPEQFPLKNQKAAYYSGNPEDKNRSEKNIAVKYERFCPGNPLGRTDLATHADASAVIPSLSKYSRIDEVPEAAGKALRWILVGRTTFIDLTYCQT